MINKKTWSNLTKDDTKKPAKKAINFSEFLMSALSNNTLEPAKFALKPPEIHPAVVPADKTPAIAMDRSLQDMTYIGLQYADMGFIGYPALAELTTRAEYRSPCETIATEMTRKWIRLVSKNDDVDGDRLTELHDAMTEFNLRDVIRTALTHDLQFGRGQVFIDIKGQENIFDMPLIVEDGSIKKGELKGFYNIEPIWTTPSFYNSDKPWSPDFYVPKSWYVLSKVIDKSRLITFIGRELPDILKPAYNFSGMSLIQLLIPYVQAFQRNRASVADILHSFSTSGIATDMGALTEASGGDFIKRLDLFNKTRDNRGLLVINKDAEEFFQFNVPLTALADLLSQCQNQMCIPSKIPMVKAFGEAPNGLGATGEGEIKVWYDWCSAQQENIIRNPLTITLRLIQLHLWGKIEPSINFEFEPLEQMTAKELAEINKIKAETSSTYVASGVISSDEERERLVMDHESGYDALDLNRVVEIDNATN